MGVVLKFKKKPQKSWETLSLELAAANLEILGASCLLLGALCRMMAQRNHVS